MPPSYARGASTIAGLALIALVLPEVAVAPARDHAPTTPPETGGVVVNEFAPSVAGQQVEEFIELRNTSDRLVTLGGWELLACLSPATLELAAVFPLGTAIPPDGHYLLTHTSHTGASPPDAHYDVEVPENGGWLLRDPWTGYTDGVGLENDLACTEGDAAPPCDWAAGGADTRDEQGKDTDDNGADFTCQPRTPGA